MCVCRIFVLFMLVSCPLSVFCLVSPVLLMTSFSLALEISLFLCVSRSPVCSSAASLSACVSVPLRQPCIASPPRCRWANVAFSLSPLLSLSLSLPVRLTLSLPYTNFPSLSLSSRPVFGHQCDGGHRGDGRGPRTDLRFAGWPLPPSQHLQHPAGRQQPAQHPAHHPAAAPPAAPEPPAGLQRRTRLLRLGGCAGERREAGHPEGKATPSQVPGFDPSLSPALKTNQSIWPLQLLQPRPLFLNITSNT